MTGFKSLAREVVRANLVTDTDDLNDLVGAQVEGFIDSLTLEVGTLVDYLKNTKASGNSNAMMKHHGYPKGRYSEFQVEKAMATFDHSDCPGNTLDEFDDVVRGCPIKVRQIKLAKKAAQVAA